MIIKITIHKNAPLNIAIHLLCKNQPGVTTQYLGYAENMNQTSLSHLTHKDVELMLGSITQKPKSQVR